MRAVNAVQVDRGAGARVGGLPTSERRNLVADLIGGLAGVVCGGRLAAAARRGVVLHLAEVDKLVASVGAVGRFVGDVGDEFFIHRADGFAAFLFAVKGHRRSGVGGCRVAIDVAELRRKALAVLRAVEDRDGHLDLTLVGNEVQIHGDCLVVLLRLGGAGLRCDAEGVVAAEVTGALDRDIRLFVVGIGADRGYLQLCRRLFTLLRDFIYARGVRADGAVLGIGEREHQLEVVGDFLGLQGFDINRFSVFALGKGKHRFG